MSIKDCVNSAVAQGAVTLEEGQQIQARFDALFAKLGGNRAREQLAVELAAEAKNKRRVALLTETRRKVLTAAVLGHTNASGERDPGQALAHLLLHKNQARFEDVNGRMLAIIGQAQGRIDEVMTAFRKGAFRGDLRRRGYRQRLDMERVMMELLGEDSGDAAAKRMAGATAEVFEDLRQRFNAAGGAIAKLDRYGLPQHHDQLALLNAGMYRWIDNIWDKLDRERMVSPLTGEKLDDGELRSALEHAWKAITTDGTYNMEPSGQRIGGQGALFKRHQDHRFLHFKDAKSWLAYQRDFGGGDVYDSIVGHISSMSRDIAMMEILGPNPTSMMEFLAQTVLQHAKSAQPMQRVVDELQLRLRDHVSGVVAAEAKALSAALDEARAGLEAERKNKRPWRDNLAAIDAKLQGAIDAYAQPVAASDATIASLLADLERARQARDYLVPPTGKDPEQRAKDGIAEMRRVYDSMTGALNAPVNSRVANVFATSRNLVSASALGSAFISSFSDAGMDHMARGFAGLNNRGVMSTTMQVIGQLLPGSRQEAVRAGLVLDSALHALHSQARFAGTFNTRTMSGYLTDRVLTLSLLSPVTQARKHAFSMNFMGTMADHAGRAYADLPYELRRTLDRAAMTAADWDVARAAPLHDGILRPNEIADRAVAERYHAMILREVMRAVPEGNARTNAHLVRGESGSFVGELSRNFAQFKSFGVDVILTQADTIAREIAGGDGRPPSTWRGARYGVYLLAVTSLIAAASLQIKELLQGRDPRDMRDPKFWGAAMLAGGGFGIYGDFLFADVNRFGGSTSSTVAGPLVGRVDPLLRLTVGNAQKALTGEADKIHVGRDLTRVVKDWTPGGTLWYTRLAWEHLALDRMQAALDPEAHKAFRRKQQQRRKEYGNDYWWAPGETSPERAPNLGAAVSRR